MLETRKQLGRGEITTVLFAKTTNQAAMSDDGGARELASDMLGVPRSQTTCHLFGWLFYTGHLVDHERVDIQNEHIAMGRPLAPHFDVAYEMAMRAKLYDSQKKT
ncbi:MAG: hypothetical protein P4L46_08085 [Fimbriimonas sp.]|nr:hypothetical protein [Fimbriimonas sp.]